jgi:hypothetical protein
VTLFTIFLGALSSLDATIKNYYESFRDTNELNISEVLSRGTAALQAKLGEEVDTIAIGQREQKIIETAESRAAPIFAEFEEKFGKFAGTNAYDLEKKDLEVCN